jgi:S1-C subfamily serine protease
MHSGDPLRRSVVKLFTTLRRPHYYQPWGFRNQETSGGSGCILAGGRILTNAHVVANTVYVQVLRTGDTRKVTAKIAFVDHDRELALLEVAEPGFFDDTEPVRFGDLPVRQDKVSVYGFPIGGNELCVTEGVVSRIEVHRYTHACRDLLAIQTDAAINPGNSGGPVFKDGKLTGIAFQSYRSSEAERIGYVVPTCIVEQFLKDTEDGRCDGVPSLGIYWQKMESVALREYFGLGQDDGGILVTRVLYGSAAWGKLREHDIVVGVDGTKVARDGSVLLRGEDRVNLMHLVHSRLVKDRLTVDIIREGQRLSLEVELGFHQALVRRPSYAASRYIMFGGFVFVPLTYDYLHEWSNMKDVDPRFRTHAYHGLPNAERKEVVLLNQVLPHDINVGYHQMHGIVARINRQTITELRDIPAAFKTPVGAHHVIELDHQATAGSDYHAAAGTTVVIRADRAEEATREILANFGLPEARSKDYKDL